MTFASLKQSLADIQKGLQSGAYAKHALEGRRDEVMVFQHQQLFNGKQSNGENIRPYYSEDLKPQGYFRSKDSAERYAAWKQVGVVRGNRDPDAPNLYINGKFHDELGVELGENTITIKGFTPYAAQIVDKYGIATFGLTAQSWGEMLNQRGMAQEIMDAIIQDIR